jgi:glucose-6-phosphate isomerase
MSYEHSIDNCLAAAIGERGLGEPELAAALEQTRGGRARLRTWRDDGSLPLLALPGRRDDLAALKPVIGRYRDGFDDILVLGTGGSSLGGRALCALGEPGNGPRIHFLENTDPRSFSAAFERLNLERTGVIAISKSGGTSETMMQFAATLARYREALGEAGMGHHITVITEPADNPMRRLAGRFGLFCLDHDPDIGGRFSALSLVGLLPTRVTARQRWARRSRSRWPASAMSLQPSSWLTPTRCAIPRCGSASSGPRVWARRARARRRSTPSARWTSTASFSSGSAGRRTRCSP